MGAYPAIAKVEQHLGDRMPDPKGRFDLFWIAVDAAISVTPFYMSSVFGDLGHGLRSYRDYSEYTIIDPLSPRQTLRYLLQTSLPGWAVGPTSFVPSGLNPFWRPTQILHHPDPAGSLASFPGEAWFYINGVATNEDVARMNADLLVRMFHRPLTLIQNSTNSLPVDLLECALGKGADVMTEPAVKAFPVLVEALNDPETKRVVVVCHSQGTIIMSNVLRAMVDEKAKDDLFDPSRGIAGLNEITVPGSLQDQADLRKLEIYAFANCADVMKQVSSGGSRRRQAIPWIESFGNEHDVVARLGMLAAHPEDHGIEIDGAHFVATDASGHFLNQHYLLPMLSHLLEPDDYPNPYVPTVTAQQAGFVRPRLYDYFKGATPG